MDEPKLPSREAADFLDLYLSWRPSSRDFWQKKLQLFKVVLFHIYPTTCNKVPWAPRAHKITLRCLRTRWGLSGLWLREALTPFTKAYFFPSHTNTTNKEKNLAYRMRGQIYSQSGSRVIRLDAFLEQSFLSLLLSFFEVSPRLPPLPQHSSLLFILYKYNQTGPRPTLVYILFFSWFVLHTYTCTKTHTYTARAQTNTKNAVNKVWYGRQRAIVVNPLKYTRINCRSALINTWKEGVKGYQYDFGKKLLLIWRVETNSIKKL